MLIILSKNIPTEIKISLVPQSRFWLILHEDLYVLYSIGFIFYRSFKFLSRPEIKNILQPQIVQYRTITLQITYSVVYYKKHENEVLLMAEIEDRYYSMPEIMKYLGISRDTALRWIATKDMPAHKVGKKWKFKVSEIDEWVQSGKAEE